MFNSPILDLVILLSFTYFVGSLMLTAINESIAALLNSRAKDLKTTICNLLLDEDWKKFAEKNIYNSQHIMSLMLDKDKHPSYIPASNFVLTILEQIKAENYTPEKIIDGINSSPLPDSMKSTLKDLFAKAQAKVNKDINAMKAFELEIETFYNNAMERASGWYKRKTRRIAIVLGFVLAIAMNIDTIRVINFSLRNKDKMIEAVNNIASNMKNIEHNDSVTIFHNSDSTSIFQTIKRDTTYTTDNLGYDSLKKKNIFSIKATTNKINELKIMYNGQSGYQMGYNNLTDFKEQWLGYAGSYAISKQQNKNLNIWFVLGVFILKILGIALTAFALQLGSSYWFDILNKFVNIRAAGKKPEASNTNSK